MESLRSFRSPRSPWSPKSKTSTAYLSSTLPLSRSYINLDLVSTKPNIRKDLSKCLAKLTKSPKLHRKTNNLTHPPMGPRTQQVRKCDTSAVNATARFHWEGAMRFDARSVDIVYCTRRGRRGELCADSRGMSCLLRWMELMLACSGWCSSKRGSRVCTV